MEEERGGGTNCRNNRKSKAHATLKEGGFANPPQSAVWIMDRWMSEQRERVCVCERWSDHLMSHAPLLGNLSKWLKCRMKWSKSLLWSWGASEDLAFFSLPFLPPTSPNYTLSQNRRPVYNASIFLIALVICIAKTVRYFFLKKTCICIYSEISRL